MITDFHDEETLKVWMGEFSRRPPNQIQEVSRRKLRMLHNAQRIEDLHIPPNNHLETLKGKRTGQWSSVSTTNGACALCGMTGKPAVWKSATIIEEKIMTKSTKQKLHNIHPGEVLREEFLLPLGISQYRLAKEIGVTEARISAICSGKRTVTADTALRLAAFLGTTSGFWLGLQADYYIEEAAKELSGELAQIHRFERMAA